MKYENWKEAMRATNRNVKKAWKLSTWWARLKFIEGIMLMGIGLVMLIIILLFW